MDKETVLKILYSGLTLSRFIDLQIPDGLNEEGIKNLIDTCFYDDYSYQNSNWVIPEKDRILINLLADKILKEMNNGNNKNM